MLFEKKNCKGERQALNTELSFFCEMLCRRSSAYVNCLSYFAFSLSTDLPNRSYCDSNTSKRIVVCIGLFISLRGDWRSLVCLIITYSWYGVRGRLYLISSRFSCSNRWVFLVGSVGHWGIYPLKQGNPLQNFKYHSQFHNCLIYCYL